MSGSLCAEHAHRGGLGRAVVGDQEPVVAEDPVAAARELRSRRDRRWRRHDVRRPADGRGDVDGALGCARRTASADGVSPPMCPRTPTSETKATSARPIRDTGERRRARVAGLFTSVGLRRSPRSCPRHGRSSAPLRGPAARMAAGSTTSQGSIMAPRRRPVGPAISGPSVRSATKQVTLSRPPAARARSTSACAASSATGNATAPAISGSATKSVSPSLQSSRRSPTHEIEVPQCRLHRLVAVHRVEHDVAIGMTGDLVGRELARARRAAARGSGRWRAGVSSPALRR